MSDFTPDRTTDSDTTTRVEDRPVDERAVDERPVEERTADERTVEDRPVDDRPVDRTVDEPTYADQRAGYPLQERAALRIPLFSPLAPIGGWLAAWGAAALATACLIEAGVAVGLGFGIANGSISVNSGFWAGLWTLVIQAGAFLLGGYVAGRMARARAMLHAGLAWLVAMLATAADAIIVNARDSGTSVLGRLHLPQWAGLGGTYQTRVVIPLVIFAAGALIGALIGGALAAGANRRERDVYRVADV